MLAKKRKTERVTARISENVYYTLDQAASILGATLNQFLVQSAFEKAQRVIEHERIITLSEEDTRLFFDAVENPPPLNEKLRRTIERYKESDLYVKGSGTQ